jgi:hypothetical protein
MRLKTRTWPKNGATIRIKHKSVPRVAAAAAERVKRQRLDMASIKESHGGGETHAGCCVERDLGAVSQLTNEIMSGSAPSKRVYQPRGHSPLPMRICSTFASRELPFDHQQSVHVFHVEFGILISAMRAKRSNRKLDPLRLDHRFACAECKLKSGSLSRAPCL